MSPHGKGRKKKQGGKSFSKAGAGRAVTTCPVNAAKKKPGPALVVVDVYDGASTKYVSGATVDLKQGEAIKATRTSKACAIMFDAVSPGSNYGTNLLVPGADAERVRLVSAPPRFDLKSDDLRTVTYRVYSSLRVRVLLAATGAPFTAEALQVNAGIYGSKPTAGGVADFIDVPSGTCPALTLDLDPAQAGTYKVDRASVATTLPLGKVVTVDFSVTIMSLRLTALDSHFAPSVENLDIAYDIQNMEDQTVYLRISSPLQAEIFRRPLTDPEKTNGAHTLVWDGKRDGQNFIDPIGGPYTVHLEHPVTLRHRNAADHERQFNVLFHSIDLGWGDWLPQREIARLDAVVGAYAPDFAGAPAASPDVIKWTWCRLGQLGYFPGPMVTTRPPLNVASVPDPLGHAIRRYRQADGELYRRIFQEGNGQAQIIAQTANVDLATIDGPLLTKLWHRANGRLNAGAPGPMNVLDHPQVITAAAASRLFVDVDRFYVGIDSEGGFNPGGTSRKAAIDEGWVPRPQIAIGATVKLVRKNNTAATALHASALGDYRIKWTWTDRAEDMARLPSYAAATPSRTNEFVTLAARQVAAAEVSPRNNARVAVGGLVAADGAATAMSCFEAHPDSVAGYAVGGRLSGPPTVASAFDDPVLASVSRVFFRPSRIAGDNYTLFAEIDRSDWSAPVSSVHAPYLAALRQHTAEFEVWRRVQFAAYVRWGNVPNAVADWRPVKERLAKAYTLLSDPAVTTTVATLQSHVPLVNAVNQAYQDNSQFLGVLNPPQAHVQFANTHALPEDPRTLEFRDIHTIGVAQFADPKNIVNELMIGLVRFELVRNRRILGITNAIELTSSRFLMRHALATLWAGQANWLATAGNAFLPHLNRLTQPLAPQRRLPQVALPGDRRMAPIPAASLAAAPATRAAILNDLFLSPVQPLLNQWLGGATTLALYAAHRTVLNTALTTRMGPLAPLMAVARPGLADALYQALRTAVRGAPAATPAPALTTLANNAMNLVLNAAVDPPTPAEQLAALRNVQRRLQEEIDAQASLATIVTAIAQFQSDVDLNDREKYPVHGVLRLALKFFNQLFSETIGKVTGTASASQCQLKDHHYEVLVENAVDSATVQGLAVAQHFTETHRVIPGTSQELIQITLAGPGFNIATLRAALPAGAIVTNLRGAGATIPQFQLSPADEARLDEQFRRELVANERQAVIFRLGEVYNVFTKCCYSLDDAVHALPAHPPGGIIACHYAPHPRPVAIETGVDTDEADFTSSTSIGIDGGVIFVSKDQPIQLDHLFAHEMSHTLFLRHWQDGEEAIKPTFSWPVDHDLADNNCIMSYPAILRPNCHTHYGHGRYQPQFCGKCNLKLRGWNLGAAALPESSRMLTPVFPNVAGLAIATRDIPDPAAALAELQHMATDLLGAPLAGAPVPAVANLRYYGLTVPQTVGGITRFVRNAEAVTGRPSAAAFGPPADVWEHVTQGGAVAISDADLLKSENISYHAAWEENLDQLIAQGGITNAPHFMAFSMPTPRFYDPGSLFHEMMHFFQRWDGSNVQEGITDYLACLLSIRYQRVHNVGAPLHPFTFNPSYLHVMQFAVDHLKSRLGIRGLARLYFTGNTDGLAAWLKAGVRLQEFNDICKQGIGDYDMRLAAGLLRPLPERHAITKPPAPPALPIDQDDAAAMVAMQTFVTGHIAPAVATADRERNVVMIRLQTKIAVFRDTLIQAKAFRAHVTDTNRVHRLERYIEDTVENMRIMKDIYVRIGGLHAHVHEAGDTG